MLLILCIKPMPRNTTRANLFAKGVGHHNPSMSRLVVFPSSLTGILDFGIHNTNRRRGSRNNQGGLCAEMLAFLGASNENRRSLCRNKRFHPLHLRLATVEQFIGGLPPGKCKASPIGHMPPLRVGGPRFGVGIKSSPCCQTP